MELDTCMLILLASEIDGYEVLIKLRLYVINIFPRQDA